VLLTDEINFGVEWLVQGRRAVGRGSGAIFIVSTPGNPRADASGTAHERPRALARQGFVYIINNANFPGGVQAVLHLLDTYGDTKVIANPHLARSTTRRRRSSPAREFRSISRASSAARRTSSRRHRSTSTPACCCR
jgi:hypothetical protein